MRMLGVAPERFTVLERWRFLYVDRVSLVLVAVLGVLTLLQPVVSLPVGSGGVAASVATLALTLFINRRGLLAPAIWLMLGASTLLLWAITETQTLAAILFAGPIVVGAGVLLGARQSLGFAAANVVWLLFWSATNASGTLLRDLPSDPTHVPVLYHVVAILTAGVIGSFVGTMLTSTVAELEAGQATLIRALHRASTDGLTGLANHLTLRQRLDEEISRARRHGAPLSVVMFDLDHFKRINDTYGHPMGDAVLRATGALLRSVAREGDIVGRYGGEEFAAILPHTDLEGARVFSERVRAAFTTLEVHPGLRVTVSAGVAQGASTGAELLERADRALYRAKVDGRNRSVVDAPA